MEIIKGIIAFICVIANTLFWCAFLLTIAVLKLIPLESWKRLCTKIIINIGECWIFCNRIWIKFLHRPKWEIEGFESLDKSNWYLSVANHQSWADIFVLQAITNRRIPMLKFFMKHILIWVPVIGLAWWALDMPFLKRYTKEEIEKRPELRGKDVKAMEDSFKRYSRYPVSIFSFAEGTRFSDVKKLDQNSKFNYLLNPKSGGIGLTLTTMPYIRILLDFTIVYNSPRRTFWDFLCGRMSEVTVKARKIEIPENLLGKNYEEDNNFRLELKDWIENIWSEKDKYIEELKT
tara:strand:- start:197 stop:1066 length:870 start_codon:yes stop_codon:yes gene_type:complete